MMSSAYIAMSSTAIRQIGYIIKIMVVLIVSLVVLIYLHNLTYVTNITNMSLQCLETMHNGFHKMAGIHNCTHIYHYITRF